MSAAIGTLRASVDLPPVAGSAAAARYLVARVLDAWAVGWFRDDAILLVSELVSNVVRHVPGPRAMRVEMVLSGPVTSRGGLWVAVVDGSSVAPAVDERGVDGGHGLRLVAALADRWGSEEHGEGKRVWFELGRRG